MQFLQHPPEPWEETVQWNQGEQESLILDFDNSEIGHNSACVYIHKVEAKIPHLEKPRGGPQ